MRMRLPLPTKDEVALVNERSLTITDFNQIRSTMKKRSTEGAVWVGIGAILLQKELKRQGQSLAPPVAIEIARYAWGDIPALHPPDALHHLFPDRTGLLSPDDLKREIDRLSQQNVVIRNTRLLSLL